MKAWHVSDGEGESHELVFAETRGKAKRHSLAYDLDDYTSIRTTRAPYADDKEHASDKEKTTLMLENGWYFECQQTGEWVDIDELGKVNDDGTVLHRSALETA